MRPRRLVLGWFFPGNSGLLGKNRISFCFDLFLIEMDCIPTVTSDPGQLLHQNNYQNMSYLYTLRQFNIAMENVHVSQVDHLLSWVIFHIFHGYQRIRIPSIPKLMVNHHVPQSPHQNCAINWGIHCIHLFFCWLFLPLPFRTELAPNPESLLLFATAARIHLGAMYCKGLLTIVGFVGGVHQKWCFIFSIFWFFTYLSECLL